MPPQGFLKQGWSLLLPLSLSSNHNRREGITLSPAAVEVYFPQLTLLPLTSL